MYDLKGFTGVPAHSFSDQNPLIHDVKRDSIVMITLAEWSPSICEYYVVEDVAVSVAVGDWEHQQHPASGKMNTFSSFPYTDVV